MSETPQWPASNQGSSGSVGDNSPQNPSPNWSPPQSVPPPSPPSASPQSWNPPQSPLPSPSQVYHPGHPAPITPKGNRGVWWIVGLVIGGIFFVCCCGGVASLVLLGNSTKNVFTNISNGVGASPSSYGAPAP